MKTIKKIAKILMVSALVLCLLLTGCTKTPAEETQTAGNPTVTEAAGEAKLTDGYYTTQVSGLNCFYHFNEDNTYYGYFFDGGITDAGTYEVQNKTMDYYETYVDEVADEASKKTASQTIVLTSYAGGAVLEIPLDGDRLCDFTIGGMSSHAFMNHEADFAYNAEEMEPSIVVQTLYNNNDSGMTLTLYHNRTFVDYTGDKRDGGTWAPIDGGYTLTSEAGGTYTLTMGEKITYQKGDETLSLTNQISAGEIVAAFTSEEPVGVTGVPGMEGATDSEVKLIAYDNGTAELVANMFGNDVIVDQGTYVTAAEGSPIPTYTFMFNSAGELVSEPDYTSATANSIVMNLHYVVSDAACSIDIGGNVMDMALSLDAALSYTFTMG